MSKILNDIVNGYVSETTQLGDIRQSQKLELYLDLSKVKYEEIIELDELEDENLKALIPVNTNTCPCEHYGFIHKDRYADINDITYLYEKTLNDLLPLL